MPADSQGLTILQSIDSTNNYAMAQVHAGLAKHGKVYFAHEQTAGKGQRGKAWSSGASENIAISLVMEPAHFPNLNRFSLSALVAVCCANLLTVYAGQPVLIKWPNDLYLGDRKAGGILIENVVKGTDWRFAIAGIGLNINQTAFPPELPNPVSLKGLTGRDFSRIDLAKELTEYVYEQLGTQNIPKILSEYNRLLYKRNETVTFRKNNIVFKAQVLGVTVDGRLKTKHAMEQEYDWGEIEWKLPAV